MNAKCSTLSNIVEFFGTPGGTRTPYLLLRRQLLYPDELLAHLGGAGDGNRTRVTSLEGWRSTIELHPHIHNSLAIQLVDFNTGNPACQEEKRCFFEKRLPDGVARRAIPSAPAFPAPG